MNKKLIISIIGTILFTNTYKSNAQDNAYIIPKDWEYVTINLYSSNKISMRLPESANIYTNPLGHSVESHRFSSQKDENSFNFSLIINNGKSYEESFRYDIARENEIKDQGCGDSVPYKTITDELIGDIRIKKVTTSCSSQERYIFTLPDKSRVFLIPYKSSSHHQLSIINAITSEIKAIPSLSGFYDVPENHVQAEAVAYVKDNNIVSGYDDGTYRPDNPINRAEFTKIIAGAVELDTEALCEIAGFPDAPLSEWYGPYIQAAKCAGIISGNPDGSFKPAANINMAEVAKIVVEAFDLEQTTTKTGDPWYQGYWNRLHSMDAIPDSANNPAHLVTRGEMAEIIYAVMTQ